MHIILMLLGMIIGLAVSTNVHWLVGIPIMGASLLFFDMGSAAWREKQEGVLLLFGLGCGALTLLVYIFR